MKIKLSSTYATPHLTAHPGSTIDVSEAEAKTLIAGKYGVAVGAPVQSAPEADSDAVETAAGGAPENAAGRAGKLKR